LTVIKGTKVLLNRNSQLIFQSFGKFIEKTCQNTFDILRKEYFRTANILSFPNEKEFFSQQDVAFT